MSFCDKLNSIAISRRIGSAGVAFLSDRLCLSELDLSMNVSDARTFTAC